MSVMSAVSLVRLKFRRGVRLVMTVMLPLARLLG